MGAVRISKQACINAHRLRRNGALAAFSSVCKGSSTGGASWARIGDGSRSDKHSQHFFCCGSNNFSSIFIKLAVDIVVLVGAAAAAGAGYQQLLELVGDADEASRQQATRLQPALVAAVGTGNSANVSQYMRVMVDLCAHEQ